jgi:arylsulfatase A-like enzyme
MGEGTEELDPDFVTLAEVVGYSPTADWSTSYVGKWHLATYGSHASTLGPEVQGWDWWSGSMANLTDYFSWSKVHADGVEFNTSVYATTDNVNDALERVAVMPEPWLLQVAFNAPHGPIHVPPADLHTNPDLSDSSPMNDLERADLEAVDTEIGRLLAGLTDDVRARTTVFVLGDNGTPTSVLLGESPSPERGKSTLYDGGIRIPLIVSGAHVEGRGLTETFAHVVDVLPTVAELAGVDLATFGTAFDGVSLLPTLADPETPSGRTVLYSEKFRPGGAGPFSTDLRTMRIGKYKLLVDVCAADVEFFEYRPNAYDEGPDLLSAGPLTPAQQKAYDELTLRLAAFTDGLTYEASTWPDAELPACAPVDDTGF